MNFLGTLDFHSHIRLRPFIKFFNVYLNQTSHDEINMLELGCGIGVNGFEFYKVASKNNKKISYTGIDLNSEAIRTAKIITETKKLHKHFNFVMQDANVFLQTHTKEKFDIIVLADIIEHINEPLNMLEQSKKVLKENGFFVVSVPTPLYPKIFGKKFHREVGHVVDGYNLRELDNIFEKNLECTRVEQKYNTGLISSVICYLNYNLLYNIKQKHLPILKAIILLPFRYTDFINSSRVSTSLFVIYKNSFD